MSEDFSPENKGLKVKMIKLCEQFQFTWKIRKNSKMVDEMLQQVKNVMTRYRLNMLHSTD